MSISLNQNNLPNGIPQKEILGHPAGLFVLFFSEMWERFCYYGMRTLLTLYVVKALLQSDATAFSIYGAYTGLVYAAPVLGGWVADHVLGYKYSVLFGGIMMMIGEMLILGPHFLGTSVQETGLTWLYIGMAIIIVGNGYFKANISSIVGKLYKDNDVRRDSGFTIFYIGINLGALLATLIAGWVGEVYGYEYGFGLAGIGMLCGIFIFYAGRKLYGHVAEPPANLNNKVVGPLTRFHVTILASIAIIPLLYLLIQYNTLVGYLMVVVALYVLYTLLSAGIKGGKILRDRMIIFVILCLLNIIFWAFFEQAGTSLTLFAERNVDRQNFLGFWNITAAQTQVFNAFYIIAMGSVFSMLWIKLDKLKLNPNIPAKFGIGIVLVGIGFLVPKLFPISPLYTVSIWALVLLYFCHTVGELFLSPIGLSMVTKLAPKNMTGTLMGAWFLSLAGANYVAGSILAPLTGTGGEENAADVVMTPAQSLAQYLEVFGKFGYIAVGCGLVVLLASPFLNKLMHGIK
ncbi:peptide MFS transporter [Ornithobacterium rhinotracheale]|uniref:Amino acid/peptide transporter (Peptide:H symporter) n=1 Tax=Ornithobacterium rhinotracheale (strain ATCC 51463 / DSM 15997 / CCUG 23171 / CIP 104009 / LMG 9086) TaxID=867902 RepID=I3ZZ10_ORNRL|nr:oligopeptide:H+ symporter [Ornithobacterium rhinotracheale]AFL96944.1 amino acid/peptide transporter (peptide:H symporter) [Ornithobacterium rhinotracheale DSM 15997]MBN3662942.1 MFS transporter [Ornithobacterium rhinotracheale]MCK0199496.1 oligopeptide:H+ symporter [Ornithobacterium rhinotracheale]MCK0202143.1 oligopeptide:H+ symporter [Ornithobacterium rhinotracheale]MCK0205065.1 oligopeptide:H+ symporter [Ornithobacterium rhinotracheale]